MSAESVEKRQRNNEIESQIKRDRVNQKNEIKMLLLGNDHTSMQACETTYTYLLSIGAGESGKSTILKQMKLIHDGGYTPEERESFKEVIYSNTLQSMKVTLEAMTMLGISMHNQSNLVHRQLVLDAPSQVETLGHELVEAVCALWEDPGVRQCVARSNEFQLNDSAR